jgi:hypothetical protein
MRETISQLCDSPRKPQLHCGIIVNGRGHFRETLAGTPT